MKRGYALTIAITTLAATLAAYYWPRSKPLTIFCAGSLRIPLEEVAKIYEDTTGVKPYIEAGGSVEVVRKIADLGRKPDIVVVADYRLIPGFLTPEHASWYIGFATNEIVLAYTGRSKYHEEVEVDPSRWYEILARNDVLYGFADPNKDPCGYRSVGLIVLAGIKYNDFRIPEKLLFNKTNISYKIIGNIYHVYVKPTVDIYSKDLIIRSKSVDLISLLEAGEVDYAFEYKSVAVQHGLNYIELPDEINLGSLDYEDFYGKVIVHIVAGTGEKELTMTPIIYGVTILDDTPRYRESVNYVKLLLSGKGRETFKRLGQDFLVKPVLHGNVPSEIREAVGG